MAEDARWDRALLCSFFCLFFFFSATGMPGWLWSAPTIVLFLVPRKWIIAVIWLGCATTSLCVRLLSFFRACVGTVSALCHSRSLHTQFISGSLKKLHAHAVGGILWGDLNAGRINGVFLYGNVRYTSVCVRVRACGNAVIELLMGFVGGGGGVSLYLCLSHSLFLKLPHHAASVDWRYCHIYYAGGYRRWERKRRGEESKRKG